MFELDKNLMVIILENLPEDGLSISALSRLLKERGIKVHRLELSGYLKALSDMQVLRERDVKPSKVFSPTVSARKSFYESLGEVIRKETDDENLRCSLALFTLNKLLKRAVFERELRLCGLSGIPRSRKVTSVELSEARSIVSKAGLKIPPGEKALISDEDHSDRLSKILLDLLLEIGSVRAYALETRQKTLEEE